MSREWSLLVACDADYVFPTAVCLQSVRRHQSTAPRSVHVLTSGELSDAATGLLRRQFPETRVEVTPMGTPPSAYAVADAARHVSSAMLLKCLGPDVVQGAADRLVYLDSDVVVRADLQALVESDLGDATMGAVADRYVRPGADGPGGATRVYVNSGVLLIDRPRWRRARVTDRIVALLAALADQLRYPDQDLLNLALDGAIQLLPRRWNYMAGEDEKRQVDAPRRSPEEASILHFPGPRKPWATRLENTFLQREFDTYAPLVR